MIGKFPCELCEPEVDEVTKHHLIPRTSQSNKRNKKQFERSDVRTRIALLCCPCHKQVHAILTEKQLERECNTLDLLRAHPEMAKFLNWIKDRPAETKIAVRTANLHR